jgi:TonB family protein
MKSRILLLTICMALASSIAHAQRPTASAAAGLAQRVFVDVRDAAPTTVLKQLADKLSCALDADPKLPEANISLRLWNVRVRTALDSVCDMIGCRWAVKGDRLILTATTPPPPVSADMQWLDKLRTPLNGSSWKLDRVPLGDVLARLSQELDCEVRFEGTDPATPITEDFRGRTPLAAFVRIPIAMGYENASMGERTDAAGRRWVTLQGRKTSRRDLSMMPILTGFYRPAHDPDEPGITLPVAKKEVRPQYTKEAMDRGVKGTVGLFGVVDVDGSLKDVTVKQSLDPSLDEQALAAARQWQFEPGRKDGKPVPVRIMLEMAFTLK